MISCADSGSGRELFSSIMRVSRSWSSEPQFTPMRTGLSYLQANSIISANCGSRLLPRPTLPGLMRYLASASAQSGCSRSSLCPLKWKSPMMRDIHAQLREPVADRRDRGGCVGFVHRDAHQLGAGARQRLDLLRGAFDVGRVGVGHGLHDDGRGTADGYAADLHGEGLAARMAHAFTSPAAREGRGPGGQLPAVIAPGEHAGPGDVNGLSRRHRAPR